MRSRAAARRQPVEGVPAGQEPLADRVALGGVAPSAERRVSSVSRSGSGHHGGGGSPSRSAAASSDLAPGQRVEPGDPRRSRAIGRGDVDDRVVARALPGDRARSTGRASGSRPRRRRRRRRRDTAIERSPRRRPASRWPTGRRQPRLADLVVARRPDDPVRSGDVRLRTNRSSPRSRTRERRAGPAVGREAVARGRRSGRARSAGPRAGGRASWSRRGARLSTVPARRARRPARRPCTRRANRGSCGSGRRPAARSSRRSPRRGPRRPGCR